MIKIDEQIAVPAPPERVWEVISDPAEVVSCIRGAELGASHDDGSFDGLLVVKFGAVRVRFGARVTLDLDEEAREGRLSARGRDGQGATRFGAHATFRVTPDEDAGSRLHAEGEVNLAGKLASLIEAGATAVVSRMTKDFTGELVRRCVAEPAVASASPVTPAPLTAPASTTAPAPATVPTRKPSLWNRLRTWWRGIAHREPSGTSRVRDE